MSEITTTIEDVNIVAYLSIRGFVAIPFIKEEAHDGKSRQIAWEIQGDVKEKRLIKLAFSFSSFSVTDLTKPITK